MKPQLRSWLRWAHLWLGILVGLFLCLMGVTGGIVALRPQLAALLSPAAPNVGSCQEPDWNRAAREVTAYAHSEINRIYGPYGADTRYHFRMLTDRPNIYNHVIYDACAGRVLGSIDFGWMDWTVDLHHNLLAGRAGRQWAGAIGIAMLVSAISGLLVWLLTKPDLRTAFRIEPRITPRTPRELHRAFGIFAAVFLSLEAFTGLWLCFPQTMRAMLVMVAPASENVRAPRGSSNDVEAAGLGAWMAAARTAIPDGAVREIRLPEGNGNVQIRMWRPGDFRILGNNVVFVSSSSAKVLAVDRYADRSASNRFTQAMAGLHYDEWGGFPFRLLSAIAGWLTPLLFVTGLLLAWSARKRKRSSAPRASAANQPVAVHQ